MSWSQDRLEGCRGFNGPYPSAPLDERYGLRTKHRRLFGGDPDMQWSFALFKTVTEGMEG